MKFRQADEKDISQLIDIRLAYLSEDYNELTLKQTSAISAQLPGYFKDHLNNDLFVYVCEDNELVISTVFLLIMKYPANPSFMNGTTGMIMNVYTLPKYRKRGIAGKLMKRAMNYAKDMGLSYLELKATEAGSALYNKLGFVPVKSKYVSMKYLID